MRVRLGLSLLLFVLITQMVTALSLTCPTSAPANSNFHITVSDPAATQVRLFHTGAWDVRNGASYIYTLSDSATGSTMYYGGAYVGGTWIGDSTNNCVVLITAPVDHAGSISITANPTIIEYGHSVTLSISYHDPDGTAEIDLYRGSTSLGTQSCTGTTCTMSRSDTPSSTGSISYFAVGYDTNNHQTTGNTTANVTGPTIPEVTNYNPAPNPTAVGTSVSFSVAAADAGSDLASITTYYGDGQSGTQTCSGGSCTKTFTHAYTSSGSFSSYAVASDSQGHTGQSATVAVSVSAPSDADGDGVPDASDQCPNTVPGDTVVRTGQYTGCSCPQITAMVPDPTRDANACTIDTCSITTAGAFLAVHTPAQDFAQPEGMSDGCQGTTYHDYSCLGGVVVDNATLNSAQCGGCTLNASQVCWDNAGYWQDSCAHLQQPALITCTAAQTCAVAGGVAGCTACQPSCVGAACGASDGCGATCSGSCASGACVLNATTQQYGCVVSACVDGRDNASVCGSAACGSVLDGCGVARSCGSCADWQVCSNGSCAAASVVVTPGDAGVVTAGSWFTLPVALSPESSSYVLSASGWPASPTVANTPGSRSVSGQPGNDEVGSHTLTLAVALAASGAPLAQRSVTLNVVCNPSDAVVGACCDSGSGLYRGEGSSCAYNSSVTGTCTAAHRCVR